MATTWIKAVHRTKSGSVAAALKKTINYAENPAKTKSGASEFLISKAQYEKLTGRNQGKNDIVGYQMRQSFLPQEVSPEEALDIGRELAKRFTKGRHQFIVAVHTNTDCVHSHIFFNSVTLDCSRKFKDFKHSAIALRRVSDQICLKYGLPIIETPGLSKGRDGDAKPSTIRDQVRTLIDSVLLACKDFNGFIEALKTSGCDVKLGKHLAVKLPDGKKNI